MSALEDWALLGGCGTRSSSTDSLLAPKLHLTSNDGLGNKEVKLILDCAPYNQGNKPLCETVRRDTPWIAKEDTSAKVTHLDAQRNISPGSRGPG